MISLEVGVKGHADLQAKLDKLKKQASAEQLQRALVAGGKVFQTAIRERTPIRVNGKSGDALAPGALRQGIRISVIKGTAATAARVLVGPSKKTAKVMRWLEFGHAVVRALGNLRSRRPGAVTQVPAYPVMRPAYEASRNEAMQAVIASLKASLKQN